MDSTLASANELLAVHAKLTSQVRAAQRENRRILSNLPSPPHSVLSLPLLPSPPPSPPRSPSPTAAAARQSPTQKPVRADLPAVKRAKVARYSNYVPEEETIRNDYSQRYVDGGEWPQNWVLGAEPERRFEEYPKQQRLLRLKKAAVEESAVLPTHVHLSELTTLSPAKFDVILIDPPFSSSFSWDTLEVLPIPSLAADPSFVFLWVGSGAGEGLEKGRAVLAKWGYRRCEDVVWIKTNNSSNHGPGTDPPTTSLLTRTKQHCLMGIRGTVRRSTDNWFVHCNVDTDVIIWEGDPTDPTRKPPEMYILIENFCLGLRRLEIFGRPYSLRRGWVTAGDFELTPDLVRETGAQSWDQTVWESELPKDQLGRALVPTTQEIEILRPKSPNRQGNNAGQSQAPINPQYQGIPSGHILPARPNMNRNPNGGFSGGVGLGLVRPPHAQLQMGMGMNPNIGLANPAEMMGMGMNQPMGMAPFMGGPMMPHMMGMMMPQFPQQMAGGFNEMFDPSGMDMNMNMMGGNPDPQMMGMANAGPMMFNPNMMGGGMNMMGDNSMGGGMNPGWNGGWHGMQ